MDEYVQTPAYLIISDSIWILKLAIGKYFFQPGLKYRWSMRFCLVLALERLSAPAETLFFFFFFLHSTKNLQYKFTCYTTYKILNDTTRTMPLGAKNYDYSVASHKTKTTYIWIIKENNKTENKKPSKKHYTLSQIRYQVKMSAIITKQDVCWSYE